MNPTNGDRRSLSARQRTNCIAPDPINTLIDRINTLLNSSGPGYLLHLCPGTKYYLHAPILFAAPGQEISTLGYPTGDDRAILIVDGPVSNGTGHTTAVDGTCGTCDGVKLRNVQINGTRAGAPPTFGGANIEFGGPNSEQVIEYVRTWDPRSWSCLHIAEGDLSCNNATVQYNQVGPAGSDEFQQWADGISVSCRNSVVRHNVINNPTDGGIVLFGAPGTQVYNNTISVNNHTLLGGINLVDYNPYEGDYTDVVVYNNTILGGFSTDQDPGGRVNGPHVEDAVIKIGVAIGPRAWFGEYYGNNVSKSGTVRDNRFSGAFSYAIALTSATNFTVQNNVLFGNTSFIGARGPNCTTNDSVPNPAPFIVDRRNVESSFIQSDFQLVDNGDALTCVLPPDGGDYWPFGGNPSPTSTSTPTPKSTGPASKNFAIGIAVGVILGVIVIAFIAWLMRRRVLQRANAAKLAHSSDSAMNARI